MVKVNAESTPQLQSGIPMAQASHLQLSKGWMVKALSQGAAAAPGTETPGLLGGHGYWFSSRQDEPFS